ncbi:MAG: hypothetical protein SH817_16045 [Leptospira sp.]|nr:hypothetical protein [Leptospira sp.]
MKTKINITNKVKKIKNDDELESALKEILLLMTKKKSDDEKIRYGALIEAVKEFETEQLGEDKIDLPDLIHFQMIQKDITQNQLAIILGDAPLVSRLLKGKAEISKKVAILLNKHLDIDFKILFQDDIIKETQKENERLMKSKEFSGRGRKKKELVAH